MLLLNFYKSSSNLRNDTYRTQEHAHDNAPLKPVFPITHVAGETVRHLEEFFAKEDQVEDQNRVADRCDVDLHLAEVFALLNVDA